MLRKALSFPFYPLGWRADGAKNQHRSITLVIVKCFPASVTPSTYFRLAMGVETSRSSRFNIDSDDGKSHSNVRDEPTEAPRRNGGTYTEEKNSLPVP